jgi:hypothetical protein
LAIVSVLTDSDSEIAASALVAVFFCLFVAVAPGLASAYAQNLCCSALAIVLVLIDSDSEIAASALVAVVFCLFVAAVPDLASAYAQNLCSVFDGASVLFPRILAGCLAWAHYFYCCDVYFYLSCSASSGFTLS